MADNQATREQIRGAAGTGGVMAVVGYAGLLLTSIMPVWPAMQQEGVRS